MHPHVYSFRETHELAFRAALIPEGLWKTEGYAWVDCTSCISFESRTALHCALFRINLQLHFMSCFLYKQNLISSRCAQCISMACSPNLMSGTDIGCRALNWNTFCSVLSQLIHFRMKFVDRHHTKLFSLFDMIKAIIDEFSFVVWEKNLRNLTFQICEGNDFELKGRENKIDLTSPA